MKTYSFKHIFLALVLAFLGAMVQPAAAAECQMQSNGNMMRCGKVFLPSETVECQKRVDGIVVCDGRIFHSEVNTISKIQGFTLNGHQILCLMLFLLMCVSIGTVLRMDYTGESDTSPKLREVLSKYGFLFTLAFVSYSIWYVYGT